jgi:hypothetical protein
MRVLRLLVKLQLVTCILVSASGASAATPTPSLGNLLVRLSPILVLHPQERFQPVPVNGFVADSDLLRPTATGWEKVEGPLPVGGADLRLDQRLCNVREGVASTDCYADAQDAHRSRPTVYGAAFRRGDRIVLQYWLFYAYNVYSPTVPAGDIWQVHEGDWESVSVLLDASGKPLMVGLSRHCEGTRRDWAKVPKRGTHPLVYVGLGSHSNFFRPGSYAIQPRCFTPQVIAIIKAYGSAPVDHAAEGRAVRPTLVRVTASTPGWMTFAGTWGADAYIHFPNNEPILYGTSPRGPAFHAQWRSPVADVLGWPRG